jgi:NAD(P)-dependent dehydrogenase (short-subunit alcohol dehydrogenase family)
VFPVNGPILITGCSSGIGRTTARYLLGRGHQVYATARKEELLKELADAGAHTAQLDVTDEESMVGTVSEIESKHGAVGALVNNAGYGEYGPVETVSMDRARLQFETNFFGMARLCQLVVPGMRRAGGGRIVNMSSVGGRMTFPGGGFYNASKYAVESLSDAMRFELAPFGITVSIIEPNLIRDTRFETHVQSTMEDNTAESGPYAGLMEAVNDQINRCFDGSFMASTSEDVATAVHSALTERRPRTRYIVSASGKLILSSRVLPDRTLDDILRRQFGLTKSGQYTGKYAKR